MGVADPEFEGLMVIFSFMSLAILEMIPKGLDRLPG